MLDVLTADDVRRQDAGCEARGIPTLTLMERAGWGVARAARRLLGRTAGRRVVVVCGKGNNAGDGLVAGRFLAARGAHVTAVLAAGSPAAAAGVNLERLAAVASVVQADRLAHELARADLAVDAVFGVGLSRAVEGPAAAAIDALNASGVPVLAVDVPSGLDADTGAVRGRAVRAAATLTLGGLKPGLLFQPGRAHAGRVEVFDIGVPADLRAGAAVALEPADVRELVPVRRAGAHKRSAGTVLVVAGSRAMPGAAALVCGGAVHGGAGLTVLAASEEVCDVALAHVPEITTIPLPPSAEGTFDDKGVDLVRARLGAVDAVVIGPGVSTHPVALDAVRALVRAAPGCVVLDADAITAFAGMPEQVAGRLGPTVLTPHAGELARITGTPAAELDADRLRAARSAASLLGAVVLFKGPGTVVADRGGVYVTSTGGEALSQGGTGDVLAGLVGAWCAQAVRAGRAPDAALVAGAAWLHGAAGDLAAARVGPHPANATMLLSLLPEAVHEVAG